MPEIGDARKKYLSFDNGTCYLRYKTEDAVPAEYRPKASKWTPKEDGKGIVHWRVPVVAINATVTSIDIRFSDVTKSDEVVVNYLDGGEPWCVSLSFNGLVPLRCAAMIIRAVKENGPQIRIVSKWGSWEIYSNNAKQYSPTDWLQDPFAEGEGVKNEAFDPRFGAAWKKAVDETIAEGVISPTAKGDANRDAILPTKQRKIVSQGIIKTKFWAHIRRTYGNVIREMVKEVAPAFATTAPVGPVVSEAEQVAQAADDLPF